MNVSDMQKKLKKASVQQKKTEKDANLLQKKELFLIYNTYAAFLTAIEKSKIKPLIKRRATKLPEHLDRAIIQAESYSDRDKLFRRLGSQCYRWAKWFMGKNDSKQAAKWMNLALRFLKLSMDPKKQAREEEITKQLEKLEQTIKEIQQDQEVKS